VVLHAEVAREQRAKEGAYEAADARDNRQSELRRLGRCAVGLNPTRFRQTRGRGWRRGRLIRIVSVRHGSISRCFEIRFAFIHLSSTWPQEPEWFAARPGQRILEK
jgi:hypothetical protein